MQNRKIKLIYASAVGAMVLMSSGVASAQPMNNINNKLNKKFSYNYQIQNQNYSPLQMWGNSNDRNQGNNRNNNWNNNWNNNNNNNNSNNNFNSESYIESADTQNAMSIENDGSVVVRGATVNSVSGNQITFTVALGSGNLSWTATVDGNTRYESRGGRTINMNEIMVGDKVTVKGTMLSGGSLSMRAALVRDLYRANITNPNPVNSNRQIFQGRVTVAPSSSLPTTLTMTIGNTTQVVNISSSTQLLNNAWGTQALTSFLVGDTVRVFGYIPNGTSSVTALVLRDTSR